MRLSYYLLGTIRVHFNDVTYGTGRVGASQTEVDTVTDRERRFHHGNQCNPLEVKWHLHVS